MGFLGKSSASADIPVDDGAKEKTREQSPDTTPHDPTSAHDGQEGAERVGSDLQDGVAMVEAATLIWTRKDLIMAYVL